MRHHAWIAGGHEGAQARDWLRAHHLWRHMPYGGLGSPCSDCRWPEGHTGTNLGAVQPFAYQLKGSLVIDDAV